MKSVTAWADVGSNGGIFMFAAGDIARRYPTLLQIYSKKITPDLVKVRITEIKPRKGK